MLEICGLLPLDFLLNFRWDVALVVRLKPRGFELVGRKLSLLVQLDTEIVAVHVCIPACQGFDGACDACDSLDLVSWRQRFDLPLPGLDLVDVQTLIWDLLPEALIEAVLKAREACGLLLEVLLREQSRLLKSLWLLQANQGPRSFMACLSDLSEVRVWWIDAPKPANGCALAVVVQAWLVSAEL